jgi:uncharacterized membrane protein YdbT with pleckstrin-like domain
MKTKPDIANPVLVLVILSILITPLLILLPITLIWTIWSRKVITYILESYRVVEKSGILYKKQTSIVSHKIDYINKDRGFTNQVFKNGNVTIHTVGSSSPELILTDVKNYEKVYEELKKQYL